VVIIEGSPANYSISPAYGPRESFLAHAFVNVNPRHRGEIDDSDGYAGYGRVRISAPVSVTNRVCSNCAVHLRSRVTTVQPSSQIS
jgi:hypothetical protein